MGNVAYRLNQLGMDGVTADHVESMMVFLHHGHVSVMGTAQWLANQRVDPQLAIQLARSAWWMNPSIPDIYNRLLDAKAEVWRKTSTKSAVKAELIIPHGFSYERRGNRYRDMVTGQWVKFSVIYDVLNANQDYSAQVLMRLCASLREGELDQQTWMVAMQTQLRILHVQNAALGAGGFSALLPGDFMRIDGVLRDEANRLERFGNAIVNTQITEAQINVRCEMYTGTARKEFYKARKLPALEYDQVIVERRKLGVAEHCAWCTHLEALGWQRAGVLPVPGESDPTWDDDQCLSNCRCDLESKIVTQAQAERMIDRPVLASEIAKPLA